MQQGSTYYTFLQLNVVHLQPAMNVILSEEYIKDKEHEEQILQLVLVLT